MAVLKIEKHPSLILRKKTQSITNFKDPHFRQLIDDMGKTMYAAPGVGLAANQVGISLKMAVIDVDYKEGTRNKNLRIFINPKIVEKSEPIVFEEGCLSLPGVTAAIKRFNRVVVEYQDLHGRFQTLTAQDLLAIALQHETDHLEGRLYIDHLSSLKKDLLLKKFKKLSLISA